MCDAIDTLLAPLLAVLRVGAVNKPAETPGIERVIDVLDRRAFSLNEVDVPEPSEAVGGLLVAAAEFTATAEDARFAEAIMATTDELVWGITYTNYTEPDMLRLLDDNYFFAPVIGMHSNAVAVCEDVSIFLTIQAPHTIYPSHVHKAPELYHVVAGLAEWERGSEGFVERTPGEWIYHSTGMRHATTTTDHPVLSMAIWTDDLDSIPVIVRA